jgi:hypothetical protein
MSKTKRYTECLKCGKEGIEQPSEILPDKGTLIKVIHRDGNICEFAEYSSISSFLDRAKKDQKSPTNMKCPACGEMGRIGNYRPEKDKKFHRWRYYLEHEELFGYWGKKNKARRHRRCYMKTQEQKNKVLEKLGRNEA